MNPAVSFHSVSRLYGEIRAADDVTLEIDEGEFFALLGPSGSGKTTCLRMIAGFDKPTSGNISLFGEEVSATPPYRRPVNTVFQDYALFPHMNVLDNVSFGLRVNGVSKKTRHDEAEKALDMVALQGYAKRKITELSGGQRQRVALARALVNKPKILLLDEPLGALDLKLREQMQRELKSLQKQLAVTFVFVTHDQTEALSMADRVAVFNSGKVLQIDGPEDLYNRPRSPFVAGFVGSSNVLPAPLVEKLTGSRRTASLRPEAIQLTEEGLGARVTGHAFMGANKRVDVIVDDVPLSVMLPATDTLPAIGENVALRWDADALHLMDASE